MMIVASREVDSDPLVVFLLLNPEIQEILIDYFLIIGTASN